MTSSNELMTKELWAERLAATKPLVDDPDHPDRPRSGFFDLIARLVRTLDEISENIPAGSEPFFDSSAEMLGGDMESLSYLGSQRLNRLLAHLTSTRRKDKSRKETVDSMAQALLSMWLDGWFNGALYGNQNPTVGRNPLWKEAGP